jgi:hypothetical protein
MNDAEVDVRRGRLTSVGETTFSATVTEPALNAFISRTASPEDSVKVRRIRLLSQRIVLEAAYLLLGREVEFRAEIEPRLASPQRLEFDPERFALFGINVPLPRAALRWVSGRLTDGFDFSTLPFPVQIRSVNVRTGLVDIAGTADVMRSLNERISYYWRR